MSDAVEADAPTPIEAEIRRAVEAIVMVAESPADPRLLAQLIEVSPERIDAVCEDLEREYAEAGKGFQLVRVAGGWRYQSRAELAPYVERFVLSGQSARLSAAALETLAIVAYKQPISRAQVAAIRGVNVDGVIRTLHQRGYIAELARDPGPGQAVLFGTTSLFLERLGLDNLDELPALGEFVPSADVVEALEAGLRIDDDDTDAVAASAEDAAAEDDAGRDDVRPAAHDRPVTDETVAAVDDGFGDDEVIDLRTGTAGNADATLAPPDEVGPVEPLDAMVLLADEPPEPSTGATNGDVGS